MVSVTSTLNISSDNITSQVLPAPKSGGQWPEEAAVLLLFAGTRHKTDDAPFIGNPECIHPQHVHSQCPREAHQRGITAEQGVQRGAALLGEGVGLRIEENVDTGALAGRYRHRPQVVSCDENIGHLQPQILAVEEVTDVAGVMGAQNEAHDRHLPVEQVSQALLLDESQLRRNHRLAGSQLTLDKVDAVRGEAEGSAVEGELSADGERQRLACE